jgi:hypothetical protein
MTDTRFHLNENDARDWIPAQIVAFETGNTATTEQPMTSPFNREWDARHDDGEPVPAGTKDAASLVHDAMGYELITGPPGMSIDLEAIADDGDGPGYRWLVRIDRSPVHLELVGLFEQSRHLGAPDATPGAGSALSVLREAVEQANYILGYLDAYVESN